MFSRTVILTTALRWVMVFLLNSFSPVWAEASPPIGTISSITFTGNTRFSASELVEALRIVRVGQTYSAEALQYDVDVNLVNRYRKDGYILVKPKCSSTVLPGDRVDVRVELEEGPQFRYGTFEVEGASVIDARDVFDVQRGDVVDYVEFKKAMEELRRRYEREGYLDATVFPAVAPDPQNRRVAATIRIIEGQQYLVREVNFSGSPNPRIDSLIRESWLLHEGQVFDSSLLQASLRRLNALQLFGSLSEEDCKILKLPRIERVDIQVRLRPR